MKYYSLDPPSLINNYKIGNFPMGDHLNHKIIFWCNPEQRAIIPIGQLHISRSLKKDFKRKNLKYSINKCFEKVICKCADREETWITLPIIQSFIELNRMGISHSFEVWEDKTLIGGLYGVSIGAVFFAESMFSDRRNGSKFSMIALMSTLVNNKFLLLDVQFMTDHLKTMGAIEIEQFQFLTLLANAKGKKRERFPQQEIELPLELLNTKN